MKKNILKKLALGAALLVSTAGYAQFSVADPEYKLVSGGIDRTYILHTPENLPADAPLVIMLHGYGGRADPARYGLNETADRHGFAVCYPQGEKDKQGKAGWNVGYPCQEGMGTDDVQFLEDLVGHLQKERGVGLGSLFCAGHSNGGEMCYQIAAQRPRLFTAVAPVSGLMLEWLYRADYSTVAVPLMEIHGTADKTSWWDGDLENKGGWGAYVAVPLAVHYWAAKDKCTEHVTETLSAEGAENKVTLHRFTGGTGGCEAWLCEIDGGGHSWGSGYAGTNELVWRFFSKYVE